MLNFINEGPSFEELEERREAQIRASWKKMPGYCERCEDCISLCEIDGSWYCDEYGAVCSTIEHCGEQEV